MSKQLVKYIEIFTSYPGKGYTPVYAIVVYTAKGGFVRGKRKTKDGALSFAKRFGSNDIRFAADSGIGKRKMRSW